jgi:acetyl-CoA C-acetyltransferase
MTACIVGWAHGKFGKRPGEDLEALVVSVAADALKDAGLEPRDVDEIYVGHFGGGFVKQDFPA